MRPSSFEHILNQATIIALYYNVLEIFRIQLHSRSNLAWIVRCLIQTLPINCSRVDETRLMKTIFRPVFWVVIRGWVRQVRCAFWLWKNRLKPAISQFKVSFPLLSRPLLLRRRVWCFVEFVCASCYVWRMVSKVWSALAKGRLRMLWNSSFLLLPWAWVRLLVRGNLDVRVKSVVLHQVRSVNDVVGSFVFRIWLLRALLRIQSCYWDHEVLISGFDHLGGDFSFIDGMIFSFCSQLLGIE